MGSLDHKQLSESNSEELMPLSVPLLQLFNSEDFTVELDAKIWPNFCLPHLTLK